MELDEQRFRAVMGHFATGVTVVTGNAPDGAMGMTTNAVCSLSLRPPLVLACFDNTSRTLGAVRAARRFAINVLRADQQTLSAHFASKAPVEEKFVGVGHELRHEVPILEDALAWVACELQELIAGGDHTITVGRVVGLDHGDGEPLLWYRGSYGSVAPAEPAQRPRP